MASVACVEDNSCCEDGQKSCVFNRMCARNGVLRDGKYSSGRNQLVNGVARRAKQTRFRLTGIVPRNGNKLFKNSSIPSLRSREKKINNCSSPYRRSPRNNDKVDESERSVSFAIVAHDRFSQFTEGNPLSS